MTPYSPEIRVGDRISLDVPRYSRLQRVLRWLGFRVTPRYVRLYYTVTEDRGAGTYVDVREACR